jgi:hypothetical protein
MIQLQPLVQYEVIRICLEHPVMSSQHGLHSEGWGHGSSTVNVSMLRTQSHKTIIKISHSS